MPIGSGKSGCAIDVLSRAFKFLTIKSEYLNIPKSRTLMTTATISVVLAFPLPRYLSMMRPAK